jgi:hypothetical protein
MSYTTIEDVKAILDGDTVATDAQISTFIDAANVVVSQHLADETDMTSALLAEIERWYAAHLISLTVDRQAQRIEIGGDTNEEYAKLGRMLEATTYGQTVLTLDFTGKLAALGKKRAKISAVTSFTTY